MALTWARALGWRMDRHLLDPIGTASVGDVVRRLVAVAAQFGDAAELAVRARRQRSAAGELAAALAEGSVVKTFAFRGATHYMAPEDAGVYLALRSASRMWELPSWQDYYRVSPDDWPALLDAVRAALADGPLTSDDLGRAVSRKRRFRHLGFAFEDGGSNLLKPIAWHGAMSFGPSVDGRATFQRVDDNPRWGGIPDLHDAGVRAVEAYVRTYGPTTPDHLQHWLGNGLSAGRKRVRSWFEEVRPQMSEVEVAGRATFVMSDDHDELMSARPSTAVRLLPGYDQWVLGPGTADTSIVPAAQREPISRKANLVIHGGAVAGTWSVKDERCLVTWFAGSGRVPRTALGAEVDRLGDMLGRTLEPVTERS